MGFTSSNKTFMKVVFALAAVAFLWVGTFGLLHHMNEMGTDGTMGDCWFNSRPGVCTMSFSEHITIWRGMFTTLPQEIGLLNLFILAVLFVILIALGQNPLRESSKRVASRWRLYTKQHPQIHLFNFLPEAFSRGILNSKTYELVTL